MYLSPPFSQRRKREGRQQEVPFSYAMTFVSWLLWISGYPSWTLVIVTYGARKNNKGYEIRISGVMSLGMDIFFYIFVYLFVRESTVLESGTQREKQATL